MQNSNALNAYKNNSVNYASKEQLLLMLLDGSVRFARLARQAIIDKDIEKASRNLIKTQNIFYELMASLDVNRGGEWANSLMSVYDFIVRELAEANIKKDVKIIDDIMPIIEEIRDTWTEAYKISKNAK